MKRYHKLLPSLSKISEIPKLTPSENIYTKYFFVFQSDGFWVDSRNNRRVKLSGVHFHELCQRELDFLAMIALETIDSNSEIPPVKIKIKKGNMTKLARKLSALSSSNEEKEFISLFGI